MNCVLYRGLRSASLIDKETFNWNRSSNGSEGDSEDNTEWAQQLNRADSRVFPQYYDHSHDGNFFFEDESNESEENEEIDDSNDIDEQEVENMADDDFYEYLNSDEERMREDSLPFREQYTQFRRERLGENIDSDDERENGGNHVLGRREVTWYIQWRQHRHFAYNMHFDLNTERDLHQLLDPIRENVVTNTNHGDDSEEITF